MRTSPRNPHSPPGDSDMGIENLEQTEPAPRDPLGLRLRRLREARGLSQREVARRAGVTNATVSLVEQARVSPSVASLRKIAGALGLSLAELFAEEPGPPRSPFFRADELVEIGSNGVSIRLVAGARPKRALQLLIERYPPGSDTGSEMLRHTGEECGVVLRGRIEVSVGGDIRELGAGEAFYFDSSTPHRFRNLQDEPCELVSAATPATF